MATRRSLVLLGLTFFVLAIASCAPPSGLPDGPTPIPSLIPVTEVSSVLEPTAPSAYTILSYPARLPSAAQGQEIYASACATCHGQDGSGAVSGARNFQDLDYMRGETANSFYAAVTEGRGQMPAFSDRLTSDERWDVVFYVWRFSTSTERLDQGRRVYEQVCAACHGADGSGQLMGSADFTDLRQMDSLAPRDLYLTVTQGRGSMPSFQARLSQDDRWAVIDYLRTFSYDPALPSETAAATPTAAPGTQAAACSTDQTNPFAWDDSQAIQEGQAVFEAACAACHGPDGRGGLPNTPDFTSALVNAELKAEPGRFFCVLSEGEGAMPAFGESLSEDAHWQVLTYLGSLGP